MPKFEECEACCRVTLNVSFGLCEDCRDKEEQDEEAFELPQHYADREREVFQDLKREGF